MFVGPSANNKIQITSSAAATVNIAASVIVISTATPPVVDGTNTAQIIKATIGAATDDTVTGAASQIKRMIECSIRNSHASTSTDITVKRTDGTNTSEVYKATLLAGESLLYNGAGSWLHYDANGGLYPSVGNAATQAEMEAGTATNKYVTPQGVNWHPGANKCWVKCGVTANILDSWNVTSLTDNGTGDVTVTIATDFSSVNYCVNVSIEMTATTYAVANTREAHVRSGGQAAGTLRCDCIDNTATTSLIKDPTAWHISMLGDQ